MLVALGILFAVALGELYAIRRLRRQCGLFARQIRNLKWDLRRVTQLQSEEAENPARRQCACGGARAGLGYTHSEFICERRTVA